MIDWSIPGAHGEPILGNTHLPAAQARGVIVIAHGFKGYKDYGMFPRLAREFAAHGDGGLIAHRFNFSHSGMTNRLDIFERPDLFERDTWGKQVFDLTAVLQAVARGELPGIDRLKPQGASRKPIFVLGHSRGGVTALLTAARLTELETLPDHPSTANVEIIPGDQSGLATSHPHPAGVITLAAPSSCNPLTDEEASVLIEQGWLESPSSRTGQRLRVGRAFLQEQIDDPAAHDLLARVRRIRCPILIIHGENDPTVPLTRAHDLVRAVGNRAKLHIVKGADHVFNTPNPLPENQPNSPQLAEVIETIATFIINVTEDAHPGNRTTTHE